jgi:hypothetical protein
VGADPEPDIVVAVLNRQSAMIDPSLNRPMLSNFLEVQRRMGAVIFAEFAVFFELPFGFLLEGEREESRNGWRRDAFTDL